MKEAPEGSELGAPGVETASELGWVPKVESVSEPLAMTMGDSLTNN